jgi:hypothetical protein
MLAVKHHPCTYETPSPLARLREDRDHQGKIAVAYETWPDGELCYEGEFIEGLQCGLERRWHANGHLEEAFGWNDGGHGPIRAFDSGGNLRDWGWMEYGIPLESKRWNEKGKVVEHHQLSNGDPLWRVWCRDHERFLAGQSDFPALPLRPQPPVLPNEGESSDS